MIWRGNAHAPINNVVIHPFHLINVFHYTSSGGQKRISNFNHTIAGPEIVFVNS